MNKDIAEKDVPIDDPCHIKDAYRYMMTNSPEARECARKVRSLWIKLRSEWPSGEVPALESYERAYLRLERYELRHAFAQGMASAYRMCLGLPYILGSEPEEKLLYEEELVKRYDYRRLDRRMEECMKAMDPVLDSDERCAQHMQDWGEEMTQLVIFRLRFGFLVGVQYGLYLCRLVDPLVQENSQHMKALYERAHMQAPK